MRVLEERLFAILDPESTRLRRHGGPGQICSARSSSARQMPSAYGHETLDSAVKSARAACGPVKELADFTAFELLQTERGFVAFQQWYQRVLANIPGAAVAPSYAGAPPRELDVLWPQAACPPHALHDQAFLEVLRAFADCTDSEGFDFFDLLDQHSQGYLRYAQVYLAICLIAAIASRQLMKFLYFHSNRVFKILDQGCMLEAPHGHVFWPRLLKLLRLLGAPGHLISDVAEEHGVAPLAHLTYEDFMEVTYHVFKEMDRGSSVGVTSVMEGERA